MTDRFDEKAREVWDDCLWHDKETAIPIISAALREAAGDMQKQCLNIAADVCSRYLRQGAVEVAATQIHNRIAALPAPPEEV